MPETVITANKVYPPEGKKPASIYPEDRDHGVVKVFPDLWQKRGPIHQGQTITANGKFSTYNDKQEFIANDYTFSGEPGGTVTAGVAAAPSEREANMAAMGYAHRAATPTADEGELAVLYATGYEAWKLFEEYKKSRDKPVEHKGERDAQDEGLPKDEIPF